jgi:Bacterial EndoU nuclease
VIGTSFSRLRCISADVVCPARGSAMQAASEQQQAAGFASLFGNEEQAAAHLELADGMRTVAGSEMIAQIPYNNIAQSGGGDVGTVVDVALAGKGIVTGGARLLARNADEVAEVVGGQADEVGGAAIRATDEFDEIAANVGIDMRHILDGHMNAKGKAVGFHARPERIDPPGSRMTEQVGLTNPDGVYQGRVEILNPATGNWVPKSGEQWIEQFLSRPYERK